MLKRIWQRLVQFFQRLFSIGTPPQPSPDQGEGANLTSRLSKEGQRGVETSRLSDTDYEQRFMQLLDGVNQGWSRGQVQGFLIAKNLTQADLVVWLQRFGERLRESPQLNDELAQRMVRLSQLGCGELGEVAGEIGRDLLSKSAKPAATNSMDNAESDEAEAWFNQGYQQAMVGNFLGAIACFDQALQIQPDLQEAWYNRGRALSDLGQLEEAITCFNQALQIKSDDHGAWFNRSNALHKLGQIEQAIASYDQVLQVKPDDHGAWFNRGNALENLGHFEQAIASFDQALQIKPDDHQAWLNRGNALKNLGQIEQAIASYDQALQFQPDYHGAWHNRGNALSNLGQMEQAIASYDQALQIKPDLHQAWHNRGSALSNLGQMEQAIASYDQALQFKPDFHEAWHNRGSALSNLGQMEQAIASYDQALQFKPDFHEAWHNRGSALSNLGQMEQAIASYDQALQFKPDFHEAWHNRGSALSNLGQMEQAIASYDQALQFKPDFHEAWHNRGSALSNLGQMEQAIASYDQALQFKPDFHEAWHNRGSALSNLGQMEQAIASYDQALQFKPDFHEAWHNRGRALFNLGKFEQAIASFDQALQIQPDYHEAWYNRSVALANLGKFEQAIASCDQALQIQPDLHEVWYNRGNALANLGKFEQAIASFDQALQIQPDYHEAWRNRGNALSDLGKFEQAIASFDQALQIQPDYHEAWYNRGNALADLGKFEQAIASFDQALQIQPDYHEAWDSRGIVLCDDLERYEEAIASFDNAIQFKPDSHHAWHNRGVAASKSRHYHPQAAIILHGQFPASPAVKLNHTLTRRGYEGELLCYREGLKYCHQDTHPEGWGFLHQAIGKAHYFQGKGKLNYCEYWRKAVAEYHQALITLTPEAFPELHLEVVQKLIRVLFGLGENDEAKRRQLQGLDVWQQLLNSDKTSAQKRQLAVRFSGFSQMRVDVLVEDGDLVPALEAAERNKNRYLTWILDAQKEQILSPSYEQIQQLLNPTTAIISWHLSPFALTTFILKHSVAEPIVIKEPLPNPPLRGEGVRLLREEGVRLPPPVSGGLRGVLQLEAWVKNWNKQYQDYGSSQEKESPPQPPLLRGEEELDKSWRENLPEMLQQLSHILNIPAILSKLTDINQLILIPHRDLHRFPLHSLFPDTFTITYLPSAQIGITLQQKKQAGVETPHTVPLLSVEHPNSEGFELLPYAEIESAAITQLFKNPTPKRISGQEATKTAVKDALAAGYKIFHFTGHGTYNFDRPKQSALFLSGKDYLTLEEIRDIPSLCSYQLVTLAACETALTGNQTIDNEYVGLVSAFLSQGVAHVVSTLWTIPEEASSLLMIYFYWQLKKGKPPTLALTKAIKWLRNLTDKKLERLYKVIFAQLPENEKPLYRFLESELEQRIPHLELSEKLQKRFDKPYYWAAFTITGQANY